MFKDQLGFPHEVDWLMLLTHDPTPKIVAYTFARIENPNYDPDKDWDEEEEFLYKLYDTTKEELDDDETWNAYDLENIRKAGDGVYIIREN